MLDLVVAGTEEAIVMVEAQAGEVEEKIMVEAMMLAHKEIKRLCLWQKELYKALDIKKREFVSPTLDEKLIKEIEKKYADKMRQALDSTGKDKLTSYAAVDALKKEVVESYPEDDSEKRAMAVKSLWVLEGKDLSRRYAWKSSSSGWTKIQRNPSDFLRSRLAAESSRFGAFHTRRNSGDRYNDTRNEARRTVYGRS